MMLMAFTDPPPSRHLIRAGWERISVYLPIILMGIIALGTYWLARNTPIFEPGRAQVAPTHDADSLMRRFSVKGFDANGRLRNEVLGVEARHYPDTDTVEIDQPRMRLINDAGQVTLATAIKAVSNADGSEVQLIGNAVVMREAATPAAKAAPRMEIHGEYLHVYMNTEKVTSNRPVEIFRGDDRLAGNSMAFDNITQVLEMNGRVHATVSPRVPPR